MYEIKLFHAEIIFLLGEKKYYQQDFPPCNRRYLNYSAVELSRFAPQGRHIAAIKVQVDVKELTATPNFTIVCT